MESNNPVPVVEQPKSNNFLIVLLSVLLIISTIIAGFFAWQTQKLVNELRVTRDELTTKIVAVEPTAEPVATESAVIDTSNWKIYTSKLLNFNLKFPVTWTGYQVSEKDLTKLENHQYSYSVCFYFDQKDSIRACIVNMAVFSAKEWNAAGQPEYFAKNDMYYFTSNKYNPICAQLNEFQCSRSKEIDQILSTFKFTN